MSTEEKLKMVQHAFEEFLKGDMSYFLDHMENDVVLKITIPTYTPIGKQFHGKKGIAEYFKIADTVFETKEMKISDYFSNGAKVVVQGIQKILLKKTGEMYELDWATVLTVPNNKISQILIIEDFSCVALLYQNKS